MKLPASDYLLTSTSMNCNPDSEDGRQPHRLVGVEGRERDVCQRTNFPLGQWVTDSVFFHVDELTTCHIQLGFQSERTLPTNSAMLVVDNVRLKRTTPYDQRDEEALLPTVVSDSRYVRQATMARCTHQKHRRREHRGEGLRPPTTRTTPPTTTA